MKSRCLYLSLMVICLYLAGCQQQNLQQQNYLLISFEKDTPITYRFISDRQITIDLTSDSSAKKSKPQTISEKLEMVITYTPTRIDPFGLSTITATCQSAKVTRSSINNRQVSTDAMEQLAGKSFTFKISPTGQIADDTDMQRIVSELGKAAFAKSSDDSRRIKNPDMIDDFIVLQWQLWDSVSSIKDPLKGARVGQTWQVQQWIPWSMPLGYLRSRITTYKLDHFLPDPDDMVPEDPTRKAIIKSTYELTDPIKKPLPNPYEGRFQMRGIMGFLRNYQFLSIDGSGTQIFNMDKGLIESDQQHYTMKVNAAFMLPLGDSQPVLTVDQTISVQQVENP